MDGLNQDTELSFNPSNSNVGQIERVASAVLGGVLVVDGLRRRSLTGGTMALAGAGLLYRGLSGHSYIYTALGTSTAEEASAEEAITVQSSLTIAKSADEIYRLWRDPQKLAPVLGSFAEASREGDGHLRWRVQVPLGQSLEWETQISDDRPGEFLQWRSLGGATVPSTGSLQLSPAPSNLGTQVKLEFRFDPPGGALGGTLFKQLSFVPRTMAAKILRRCKSLLETGEIPTLAGSPSARDTKGQN